MAIPQIQTFRATVEQHNYITPGSPQKFRPINNLEETRIWPSLGDYNGSTVTWRARGWKPIHINPSVYAILSEFFPSPHEPSPSSLSLSSTPTLTSTTSLLSTIEADYEFSIPMQEMSLEDRITLGTPFPGKALANETPLARALRMKEETSKEVVELEKRGKEIGNALAIANARVTWWTSVTKESLAMSPGSQSHPSHRTQPQQPYLGRIFGPATTALIGRWDISPHCNEAIFAIASRTTTSEWSKVFRSVFELDSDEVEELISAMNSDSAIQHVVDIARQVGGGTQLFKSPRKNVIL